MKCSEKECTEKAKTRGLCGKHYQRKKYWENKKNGIVRVYPSNGTQNGKYTHRPKFLLIEIETKKVHTLAKHVEATLLQLIGEKHE